MPLEDAVEPQTVIGTNHAAHVLIGVEPVPVAIVLDVVQALNITHMMMLLILVDSGLKHMG